MALLGPPLVTVIVNVTLSPTLGVGLFTVFVNDISAWGYTVVVALTTSSSGVSPQTEEHPYLALIVIDEE